MAAGGALVLSMCSRVSRNRRRTQPECVEQIRPRPFSVPPPQKRWNELLYPPEWPLCTHEMSMLLPHLIKEGRRRLEAYFTRVFDPISTYPDSSRRLKFLRDEKLVAYIRAHSNLERNCLYADYVLPMGYSSERHDLISQETHASKWIGFRQPVLVFFRRSKGRNSTTHIRQIQARSERG